MSDGILLDLQSLNPSFFDFIFLFLSSILETGIRCDITVMMLQVT